MIPTSFAPMHDAQVRTLAEKGDKDAQAEMARRGLAFDPEMEKERHKRKREFRVRKDWA